ncbi:Arc family DNA-binding protein [Aureimonas flava]|uniref:Arc family DNA-binding protein n=1 Tax=Aureimonas flava TaxID=2320271 RepID=A0A3A1WNA5_9HYPH|nr:Arc family DNA-binding protein [Aureimonas flava]RIY01477.1 Arc family DNA-binding protein [Aureimonas flava]
MAKTGRESFQQMLRLPDGMRERLKAVADSNGRSVNAEIVQRLEDSFDVWPAIRLPSDLLDEATKANEFVRNEFEKNVRDETIAMAKSYFTSDEKLLTDIHWSWDQLTKHMDPKDRDFLFNRLAGLIGELFVKKADTKEGT